MERIANTHDDLAMISLCAERAVGAKGETRKTVKTIGNLRLETTDVATKAGLLVARRAEWEKWKQFSAVYLVAGEEKQKLFDQGHTPLPLQWIEVDENEHKRRPGGPPVEPCFKSKLVNRGDLEDSSGIRIDSPTCDFEGLNLY